MEITLIQTADAECYRVMFDVTSVASQALCARHGIHWAPYIGIKRGYRPWHATFNRIGLLSELVASGFRGWAIYLDADSYPFELDFDVRGYLRDNAAWGIIAAAGGVHAYTPNNGILLLNLDNADTRAVITAWQAAFEREMPDEWLRTAVEWTMGDQHLLHPLLHQRGDYDRLVKIEPFSLIGWPQSSFLRQVLRQLGDFPDRCRQAHAGVAEALHRIGAA